MMRTSLTEELNGYLPLIAFPRGWQDTLCGNNNSNSNESWGLLLDLSTAN